MAASPAADGGGVDAGDCLDILDENVALLRQCIKRGVPVVPTEDGKSFTLGDVLLPKVQISCVTDGSYCMYYYNSIRTYNWQVALYKYA